MFVLPFFASADATSTGVCGTTTGGNSTLNSIMTRVKDTASALGVGLAVIGFVIAGIIYLTSAGGERMNVAKKALIAAVIGSALVALAQGASIMTGLFCWIVTGT